MKTLIQFIMLILGLVVIVNIVIFIKELELGFSSVALYRIPFIVVPSLGILYLYRHYAKLVEKAEDELKKKIEQETLLALNNTEDYVLRPTLTYVLILLFCIAVFGIAPLYFGIKLMPEYTDTAITEFKEFCSNNGISLRDWRYVMETWKTPSGNCIERHYFMNKSGQSYWHR